MAQYEKVMVYLTPEEKELLTAKAKTNGLSLNAFIKKRTLEDGNLVSGGAYLKEGELLDGSV